MKKPKFNIGQRVYAYIRQKDIVVYGLIFSVNDDFTYTVGSRANLFTFEKIPEYFITKTIGKMCKKILGKEYIYGKVIEEYLKGHLKEDKNE